MSVWKNATYKVNIVKALYEADASIVPRVFGKTLSPFLQPDRALTGLDPEDEWEVLATRCRWKHGAADDYSEVLPLIADVQAWKIGTEAIYAIVRAVNDGHFQAKDQVDFTFLESTMTQFSLLLAPSTQLAPKVWCDAFGKHDPTTMTRARMFYNAAQAIKTLKVKNKGLGWVEDKQAAWLGPGTRRWYGARNGFVRVWQGAKEFRNTGLVFTNQHMSIVIDCLLRISNLLNYAARAHATRPLVLRAMVGMLNLTLRVAGRARSTNAYKVCRAFHKARAYAQMRLFNNVHVGADERALAEYAAEGLESILPMQEYLDLVESIGPTYRADVMAVYKWMPPPDFDATAVFAEVKSWHDNTRPSGADPNADPVSKDLWERVRMERKRNVANAYHRMTGEYPPGLKLFNGRPNQESLATWEPNALLVYKTMGKDIASQVSDKTTVSASLRAEEVGKTELEDRSFLLWYMANKGVVDTNEDRKLFASGALPEDNYVRVAYKPEAHKPNSRLFYMAPPRQRLLLAELEGNLSRVARAYPGSLQGKSAADKTRILREVMDIGPDYQMLPGWAESTTYIVTFDLTKFSPKSNAHVLKDYHAFWAKVYAVPEIADLSRIGAESIILHTTDGIAMEYRNKGADLEGFRGRMMTMFHVDMLGAACRIARERNVTNGLAHLACFIDDGAVRVSVTGEATAAVQSANAFLAIMQDVYAAAGQENNPDKTVVSPLGGELLAEQYYKSARLPAGIKAAMRLIPDYENPAASLPEDFDALFATAQGAVKDGCDWIVAYTMYVEACILAIMRWAWRTPHLLSPGDLALKLLTPKSYGGFGLMNLQGLVTTAVVNVTVEGLGMLNRAMRACPEYRARIGAIVSKNVLKRSPVQILRDPLRIRAMGPVMIENRLTMRVIGWLETQPSYVKTVMSGYTAAELKTHATLVAQAILSEGVVSVPVLTRAWKATPLALVEALVGKFKRSATIISILSRKGVGDIRAANAKDVQSVLCSSH